MREGWLATLHCLQQNVCVCVCVCVCACVRACVCVVIGEYNLEFYFGSTVGAGRIMIQVGS